MEAITLSQVFSAVSTVSSVMGAFQQMSAGKAQAEQYKIQGLMAQAKGERDAVNAEIQGNTVLENLRRINSAAIASGFAGGVNAFSGSTKLMQTVNDIKAGEDFNMLQVSAKEKRSFGEIQNMLFQSAADEAISSSKFKALTTLAGAAKGAYDLMPGGGAAPSFVSGFEDAKYQIRSMNDYTGSTSMMTNDSIRNPFQTGPQYNVGPRY